MPVADKIINISVILSSKLITSADLPTLAAGASHHNNTGQAQPGHWRQQERHWNEGSYSSLVTEARGSGEGSDCWPWVMMSLSWSGNYCQVSLTLLITESWVDKLQRLTQYEVLCWSRVFCSCNPRIKYYCSFYTCYQAYKYLMQTLCCWLQWKSLLLQTLKHFTPKIWHLSRGGC